MEPVYPRPVLLVLAHGDVASDGSLTTTCCTRLACAQAYAEAHGCRIMVAAGYSQRNKSGTPLSSSMAQWLRHQGFTDVIERVACTFNTRGELWEFAGYPGAHAICSDTAQLGRTRELIREMVGPEAVGRYHYVATNQNSMPARSRLLEPAKWIHIWLPWWIRVPFVRLLWVLRLNTS